MNFLIFRSKSSTYFEYEMEYQKGMTVLDVILYVQQHVDSSLAFRYECRQGVCGTCGVTYNGKPVLSCSTQIRKSEWVQRIGPLENFPVEKDLIVDLSGVLKRCQKIKPYMEKYHDVLLSKSKANESKGFRRCIECGCCIAGSPTVKKNGDAVVSPMELVKIARYVSDPRDRGIKRKEHAVHSGALKYSLRELQSLSDICPRGVSLKKAIEVIRK
ncbi:succinate dehydrogenase/fumarate reductase iron-sulfur subunit [Candidatus Gottesmanbacteria bacterium]|nr:succinate dehydrogenase/fumarate reductase iron-sulfur subunit [Candidatus Gottesmanbacteria bacterium]